MIRFDRKIDGIRLSSKRVYVYWNLHKKVWSVRESGIVLTHAKKLSLRDCKFLVGTSGRERVRREGKKNVHAGVSGLLYEDPTWVSDRIGNDWWMEDCYIKYNPYKNDTFVERTGVCDDTHPRPVYGAQFVFMDIETLDDRRVPRVMAVQPQRHRQPKYEWPMV